MASVLKLDPVTGDLAYENNRLVVISQTDAILQRIKTRLRWIRGEWFLDLAGGVPYWEEIMVKNPQMVAVMGSIRTTIEDTPGVDQVLDLKFEIDATRTLAITFSATLVSGDEITATTFPLAA